MKKNKISRFLPDFLETQTNNLKIKYLAGFCVFAENVLKELGSFSKESGSLEAQRKAVLIERAVAAQKI